MASPSRSASASQSSCPDAAALLARGDSVVGLDNFDPYYDRTHKERHLRDLLPQGGFDFVTADLRDEGNILALFKAHQPDAVAHLAAMAAVRLSFTWMGIRKTLTADQKTQAASPFGAEGQSISAAKKLLDTKHPAFQAVTGVKTRITNLWKDMTLPYPEPGIRLIRRDQVDRFHERATLLRDKYKLDAKLMKRAARDAIFMNCLPALRGYEQTAEVIDGPQSVVFDEAENRLHVQKAVMIKLLAAG